MSAVKWTNKHRIPKDTYVLAVIEESFGPSKSSGNPMITLTSEIRVPETVDVAGEQVMVAGVKTTSYYPTIVYKDGEGNIDVEKTEKSQARVRALYELFGLDSSNINFENPVLGFKDKLFHALLYSDESEQRKSPTKEQLAKGIKQGDVILHPITKKPLVSYYPKIDEIFGLAETKASGQF